MKLSCWYDLKNAPVSSGEFGHSWFQILGKWDDTICNFFRCKWDDDTLCNFEEKNSFLGTLDIFIIKSTKSREGEVRLKGVDQQVFSILLSHTKLSKIYLYLIMWYFWISSKGPDLPSTTWSSFFPLEIIWNIKFWMLDLLPVFCLTRFLCFHQSTVFLGSPLNISQLDCKYEVEILK